MDPARGFDRPVVGQGIDAVFVAKRQHGRKGYRDPDQDGARQRPQKPPARPALFPQLGGVHERRHQRLAQIEKGDLLHHRAEIQGERRQQAGIEEGEKAVGRRRGQGEIGQAALTDQPRAHQLQHETDEQQQQGGAQIHAEGAKPGGAAEEADDKQPAGRAGAEQAVFRFGAAAPRAQQTGRHHAQMAAGEIQNEQKKDPEGPHHLHLFHPRQHRSEGGTERRRRQSPAEQLQQARQQAAKQEEKPEAEGHLFGGEVGKTDEGRIEVDFELVEAGEQAFLGHERLHQNQGGNRWNLGEIGGEAVQQMQRHG